MKRSIAAAVVLVVSLGALAPVSSAKKPKRVTRTAESLYDAPAIGSGAGICPNATNSCARFPTGVGEKFLTLEITDSTGLPVYATVGQDLDGDTFTDQSTIVCGKTTDPIAIEPGIEVVVFPWAVGRTTCPGVATSGKVKATFSNLP